MIRPLEASEENGLLFKTLLDTAPDAILVVDQDGSIVFANLQTERMFGYERDALLGQPIEVLIPARFRDKHHAHRAHYASDPKVRPMGSGLMLFGVKRDGEEFRVEISLSPVSTSGRKLVSASIRDVGDRVRAEAKMRKMQEQLLSAVESIQGAFAIFDREDRLVLCNSTYRALWGNAMPVDVIGRPYEQLFDACLAASIFDYGDSSREAFRARCLEYHADPRGVLDLRLRDGRAMRFFARRTPEEGLVETLIDITEDVAREAELEHARGQAEAASLAKSEFLSSMSHELRTPLNAILGFAQLLHLDKKSPLSDRHRERVEHVLKGGEHLLRLIDDILDLTRIEAGRVPMSIEPVQVAEVLGEVEATLGPMSARGEITLVIEPLADDLPDVLADRTRFKQILMNFGGNAIKYGKRGGHVRLRASVHEERLRVSVEDDGIGIPLDKQDKLFSPFHRAGQETGPIEGTGIGLTISKRLCELMNGQVGFQSEPERGSTFWVELPVHRASKDQARRKRVEPKPEAASTLTGPKKLVVYIEDNPSNIAFMQEMLADFEHVSLLTAPTAEIGLPLVRARLPAAVIMDINLPGMNGVEATQKLAEWPETRDIPVIALSADVMMHAGKRARDAGVFYRYLAKPVRVDELSAVLDELLCSA